MIGIIDYGMGNLKSVSRALEFLEYPAQIVDSPDQLEKMSGLILPGVGSFPKAMENLIGSGFIPSLKREISTGKPLLGICLGMQLLFQMGYEEEPVEGLGLLKGQVKRLTGDLKIPHMGWNRLICKKDHPLWEGLTDQPYLYFVHSFALDQITPDVIGTTIYGEELPVAVARDNLMGVQFHPEKSGEDGLKILRNFGEMIK